MERPNPNTFAGNPLDRAGVNRKNPTWVEQQRQHPDAIVLPYHKGQPLLRRGTPHSSLGWLTFAALADTGRASEAVLLGLGDGAPHWAVDVSTDGDPIFGDLGEHTPLRNALPYLTPADAAIAGQGAWLLDWHRRNRFCARYGDETIPGEGGFKRVNPKTGTEHFPRTDPVAIVLPVQGDRVCLGRGVNFPPGFYSALAGYAEPCETIEECAAREVFEEVGLAVTDLSYRFSQPWPFPSSLMLGFIATVQDGPLTLDPDEIVDAKWLTRDDVAAAFNGQHPDGIMAPPPFAVAHQLLKEWVSR